MGWVMARNPSGLTDHVGFWLRMVSNHVSHSFAARLATHGVTVAEWVMLRCLHGREPLRPSVLADEMGLTRGAVTRLGDRLMGKGLIARQPDPDDARAHTFQLTAAGESLVPILAGEADRNEAATFGRLDEKDRAQLETLLRRMAGALGLSAMPIE